MASEKKSSNFVVQGAILGIASIIVRLIGVIYRVPLNNILGERGVAYYSMAYDIYSILLLISSYSIPLAVSKMVSARVALGQYRNTRKIFFSSIGFGLSLGSAAFAVTYFGADIFAKIGNLPQCALALRVLSPALVIMSVLGVLRGYFQGMGTMVPTAFSNIIEQIVNAIVSLVAAKSLYNSAINAAGGAYSAEAHGAAGGTLGTVMGAFSGLVFLIFLFLSHRKKFSRKVRKDRTGEALALGTIIKVLVTTILPVIISTTIYNLGSLLDSTLFNNIMANKGMSADLYETLIGMYTGNYRLLINVPVALASALASSLIPSIVTSMTQKSRGQVIRKVEFAIKVMMLVSMPCAAGMGVLARPIINLLFPSSIDPGKVSMMLYIGCISIVLYSLSTITNSILQGIDKMRIPVYHSAVSLLVHIILLVISLYLFRFNIFCVVVTDVIFALMMCILNQRSLSRYLNYSQEISQTFVKPAICSVIMGAAAYFIYHGLYSVIRSNAVCLIFSIICAVIIYFLLLFVFRVIDAEELASLPGGSKLLQIARKLKMIS